MKTALMFSGQGSQYVGMAADLVTSFGTAKKMAEEANAILGFDLIGLMADGPVEDLTKTLNTQPALFLHEAMVLTVTGIADQADAVAGHSLGEYSALYAAGTLSFEDALRLVRIRGELMFSTGSEVPGTMAAVVGLSNEDVETIAADLNSGGDKTVVPANYNAPGQVVISGSRDHVREILPVFKEKGAKIVKELQVSGAFHSPLMETAKEALTKALKETTFNDAKMPVYVNVSASPVTSAADLRQALIDQLVSPVKWAQSLSAMSEDGIERFVEIGPKKVLQGLVKRTVANAAIEGIDTAEDCSRIVSGDDQ